MPIFCCKYSNTVLPDDLFNVAYLLVLVILLGSHPLCEVAAVVGLRSSLQFRSPVQTPPGKGSGPFGAIIILSGVHCPY